MIETETEATDATRKRTGAFSVPHYRYYLLGGWMAHSSSTRLGYGCPPSLHLDYITYTPW